MNILKLTGFGLIYLLCFQTVNSQNCIIQRNEIIPDEILNAKKFINPNEITNNSKIIFNKNWIERAKAPGQYPRKKNVVDTSIGERKNSLILKKVKDAIVTNSSILYNYQKTQIDNQIDQTEFEPTQFKGWLAIKTSEYKDESFFLLVISNEQSNPIPKKFRVANLSQYKNIELKLIRHIDEIVFSIGDSVLLGGVYDKETTKNTPMFEDLSFENQRSSSKLDSSMIGRKVILSPINDDDFSRKPFPFYKISRIKFEMDDRIILLLESYDSEGKREDDGFVGVDLKDPDLQLYDYDCSLKEWNEYNEYLRENFSLAEIKHIKSNTIFIGMREKALYESIGQPHKTNTTIVENLEAKQCVFGNGIFVYLENGKVSAYQNIESLNFR